MASRSLTSCYTTAAEALVARDDVDVVVEVIGGIEPARSLILTALDAGASVVTANKALLADDGGTLFAAAEKAGRDLYFEAAVAGAIPIVRPLRDSLAGDSVRRVLGIVNGTTNFILDRMDSTGASFQAALEEAQALGFAEADPDGRCRGLRRSSEGGHPGESRVPHAGLALRCLPRGHQRDQPGRPRVCPTAGLGGQAAGDLRAGARRTRAGHDLGTRPPCDDPRSPSLGQRARRVQRGLRRVRGGGSADVLRPGAGGAPTASAVLGDIVTVARHRLAEVTGPGESTYADCDLAPMGETSHSLPRRARRGRPAGRARERGPPVR